MSDNSETLRGSRPLLIGDPAPAFWARTTHGERGLASYRGRWLLFLSHPADFTPVCTSEFIGFARANPEFQRLDCDLLALSVDSLYSHIAWVQEIAGRHGVTVPFPIIEDPTMVIARAYGMLHPDANSSSTVRTSIVIDPDGIVRATSCYPLTTGRNVAEHVRLVAALRQADADGGLCPEGWLPGQPLLRPPPNTILDLGPAATLDALVGVATFGKAVQ